MNWVSFSLKKYMNGSSFSLKKYMNGLGSGDSSRTSVPKIMASYPPPPPVIEDLRRANGTSAIL